MPHTAALYVSKESVMNEEMTTEELKKEADNIGQSSLPSAVGRAVIYMLVVYAVTHFFPALFWLWYVLGAYLVFDVSMVIYLKYAVYKFKKNLPDE